MRKRIGQVVSFFFLGLLPVPALGQCSDPFCQKLQNILDAAATDFRLYRADRAAGPDVSLEGALVPCQISTWANNVPMYICYGQVPFAAGQKWYARALQSLETLNPSWSFQIKTPGEDRYVDAGPPDCEIPPTEGPYIGQCPVHLQAAKQPDGTAKLYFLMNSLSSPYLLKHPPGSPTKPAAPPTVGAGCDDFCQGLKKVWEARSTAFEDIRVANSQGANGETSLKLAGAKECAIREASASPANSLGAQYVCYWREASRPAAEARFRDLVLRLEVLLPSSWSTGQANEVDDYVGTDLTAWHGVEPGGKHEVRVYLAAESVGLHITASN